jgi:hypothetical protein
MIKDPQLEAAIVRFVEAFALVFDNDWEMTKDRICDPSYVTPSGTFISPGVSDESNNWANRGNLLDSYRRLVALLQERNVTLPDFVCESQKPAGAFR